MNLNVIDVIREQIESKCYVSPKIEDERNPQFTVYEAAVLLYGYLDNSLETKSAKAEWVSKVLRQLAINQGYDIDDSYRNKKGIAYQMASLEVAVTGIEKSIPPTTLFNEIVKLYNQNQTKFYKIASEALEKV